MKLGYRGKLFIVSLSLVMGVVVVTGAFLSTRLRSYLELRIETEMRRHASVAASSLERLNVSQVSADADRLADKFGRAAEMRVTIIRRDGVVLGDSELTLEGVRAVENHGRRPEVLAAVDTGTGVARRFSTTLVSDMLYVAVRFGEPSQYGVVRFAMSLADVDTAISSLRVVLALAGLIALLVAAAVAAVVSHRFTRTLRELYHYARRLSEGRGGHEIRALSARDELGGVAGSLGDLAERLEEKVEVLASERDRFEAVLDSMEEAVLSLDSDGRIQLINRAGVLMLSLADQPVGKTVLETVRSPELYSMLQDPGAAPAGGLEFELPGAAGRRAMATSAVSRSGTRVLVLRDVTETRRLESMRRDFVANVSHELRTPISVIRANAETLVDGALADAESRDGFVHSILRNAERLTSLIDDLLDISRIEEGKLALSLEAVDLLEVFARAQSALGSQAAKKGITIERAPVEGSVQTVWADSRALEQVVLNYLDNAIKYTPDGGHVVLGAEVVGDDVRLEISDDGPGIAETHRERLFERFYRVDTGRSREMGGTGLGLSIVKHLAFAMGGQVGMRPGSPRGAVFWLQLPRG